MDGAADRFRNQRALVWWGAMMPLMKKPPTFDDFAGGAKARPSRSDLAACVAAWDRIDRALMGNRKRG